MLVLFRMENFISKKPLSNDVALISAVLYNSLSPLPLFNLEASLGGT